LHEGIYVKYYVKPKPMIESRDDDQT